MRLPPSVPLFAVPVAPFLLAGGRRMSAGQPHIPVLLAEVLDGLSVRAGGTYCDGTFGAGGYTRAILEAGAGHVVALDRDPTAISAGYALVEEMQGRLTLVETPFSDMAQAVSSVGHPTLDGVVLDIGVSSMQLDRPERGFSFRHDGPLDMRMAMSGPSAADLVATLSETELADLIYTYGEERHSRLIARAIVMDRAKEPFTRTRQLADMIARVIRSKPGDIHPATRTFQALRIAVNDELGELERALEAACGLLKPGGRLAVVTFHSLEDRIVKTFFAQKSGRTPAGSRHAPIATKPTTPDFALVTRKPVEASDAECAVNPRARSAKLRVLEKTDRGGPH